MAIITEVLFTTATTATNGWYWDEVSPFGNRSTAYEIVRELSRTTFAFGRGIAWPTPKPPKNWRWFDVFRALLAPIPLVAPMARVPIVRAPTAVSMAQAARLKRRLAIQRMRQRD